MSLSTPVAPRIERTKSPLVPCFEFEWHPSAATTLADGKGGKVYVLEIPGTWEDRQFTPDPDTKTVNAWCIAEHVDSTSHFYGAVQTFLRGWRKAKWNENVGTR